MRAAFDQVQKESSELIVIDRRLDNTAPWQEWANQIVDRGFAIVSIGPGMQDDFHALQQLAGAVGFRDKQEFCFVDRTDGYFPVDTPISEKKIVIDARSSTTGIASKTSIRNTNSAAVSFTRVSRATRRRSPAMDRSWSTRSGGATATHAKSLRATTHICNTTTTATTSVSVTAVICKESMRMGI